MLKTFDVTHFRRYVTPPDNTSKQIRRFAFSVIDVYKALASLFLRHYLCRSYLRRWRRNLQL